LRHHFRQMRRYRWRRIRQNETDVVMGPTQLRIDADSSAPHAWCRVRRKMDAWRGDAIIPERAF
jgi:hypothetical protein